MPDKKQKKKKPVNNPDSPKRTTPEDKVIGPLPEENKNDKNQDEFFKKLEQHFPKKYQPSIQKPVQEKPKQDVKLSKSKMQEALKELSDLTKPSYKKDFEKFDKQKEELAPLEHFEESDLKEPSVEKFSEVNEEEETLPEPEPIKKKSEEKENKLPSEKELEEVLAEKKAERKQEKQIKKAKEPKKLDPEKAKKKAQILKDLDKEPEEAPKGKELMPELDSLGDRKAKQEEMKKHIITGKSGSNEDSFAKQPESQAELAEDLFDHEQPKVQYRKGESNTLNMIIIASIIAAVFILGIISYLLF